MIQMSSRERVHAAVRGLPLDRVPVFMWLNAHTGVKLMARYRPSKNPLWNAAARLLWDRFDRPTGEGPSELWRLAPLAFDVHTFNWANAYSLELGADMVLASHATPWRFVKFFRAGGRLLMRDRYGTVRGLGQGIYPDMVEPAIKDVAGLAAYRFPDFKKERLYDVFRRYRKAYPEASVAAEIWGVQDFTGTQLVGMEKFMFMLMDHPEQVKTFLARVADFHIEVARRSVAAGADVVMIFDDYGFDRRPLISMDMWKEFTYPQLRRQVAAIHEAGALACLHSCGYQMPFLEHYAAAGVDMLHAFQPQAGNDFAEAYGRFGDRLTFVTGIDIQRGESMSAADLKAEIVANYRTAGLKGHHVLGTTHEIQYTMPDENARAVFDTVREIQEGRHDH